MTPAGRPPRSKQPADERITIRLTKAELALLEQAADGADLSNWIRRTALESWDVQRLEPSTEDAADFATVFAQMQECLAQVEAKVPDKIAGLKSSLASFAKITMRVLAQIQHQSELLEVATRQQP